MFRVFTKIMMIIILIIAIAAHREERESREGICHLLDFLRGGNRDGQKVDLHED
jgi:hypothetical protein